jgi:hypothetical protein
MRNLRAGTKVYDFEKEMANSIKYTVRSDQGSFSIYVPDEVFGDMEYPTRIYLQIAIPVEPSS